MRILKLKLLTMFIVSSLGAQDFWLDVGYGASPSISSAYISGFRGVHLVFTVDNPWGDVVLHYANRATFVELPSYYTEATGSSSTFSVHYGGTWTKSRFRFGISTGIGLFRGKFKAWGYPDFTALSPVEREWKEDRLAIPADMRICWNFSDHIGFGASVSGAYVKNYSYIAGGLFIRFGTR